jgi:hypothetical protein
MPLSFSLGRSVNTHAPGAINWIAGLIVAHQVNLHRAPIPRKRNQEMYE